MWQGDVRFVLKHLILKDFRIRYRNMSLGVFWSLLNPLVMMALLTFIFTRIFTTSQPKFPVFVLRGLVPLSFFQVAWSSGTNSLIENSHLVKKVGVPSELFPVASVLSNFVHFAIQLGLLITIALMSGLQITAHWLWLPAIIAMEVIFSCGLVLATAGLNVYIRDTRYVVESLNTIMFWMVPVFYDFSIVPAAYAGAYQYNPLAAMVLATRQVIMQDRPPSTELMLKAVFVSIISLGIGYTVFTRFKGGFYDHL